MNDDELMNELFSAFDDVSASDALKSSTLDFIMGAAAAAPVAGAEESVSEPTPEVAATPGGKPRKRARWQAMRVAAVAACFVLALTGGVAYGYPASTVLVTQGGTTVELHVNVFGQVLSASASDEETQELINQMGLVHTSFEDSVSRVSDSLKESNPKVPVEVVLNGVTQTQESGNPVTEILEAGIADGGNGDNSSMSVANSDAEPSQDKEFVVEAEPTAPVASTGPVVSSAPEVAVVLSEPNGVTASDSQGEKADSGKRSSDDDGKSQSSSSEVDGDSASSIDNGKAAEPAQPSQPAQPAQPSEPTPVVDGGSSAVPAEQPTHQDGDVSKASEPVDDEEEDYSTTRPSHYSGDEDD